MLCVVCLIPGQSNFVITLLDVTTNRTTLGTRIETIRYQQSFSVPLTLVGQDLTEIAKHGTLEPLGSGMTHLHFLNGKILNHNLIVIADQLGREFLHQVVLNVGHPTVITLQLGSRFGVIFTLGGLLAVGLALVG